MRYPPPTRLRLMSRLPQLAALLISLAPIASRAQPAPPSGGCASGVVIETIDASTAPDRAGLESGDVLLTWQRTDVSGPAARGRFDSPFDLYRFLGGIAPRGHHTLTIDRRGRRLTLRGAPGPWTDVTVRPHWTGWAKTAYDEGLKLIGQTYPGAYLLAVGAVKGQLLVAGAPATRSDFPRGLQAWRELAAAMNASGEPGAAAWMQWRVAWELVMRLRVNRRSQERIQSAHCVARRRSRRSGRSSRVRATPGTAGSADTPRALRPRVAPKFQGSSRSLRNPGAIVRERQSGAAASLEEASVLQELATAKQWVSRNLEGEAASTAQDENEATLARAVAILRAANPTAWSMHSRWQVWPTRSALEGTLSPSRRLATPAGRCSEKPGDWCRLLRRPGSSWEPLEKFMRGTSRSAASLLRTLE